MADFTTMLNQLRSEREGLDEAILAIERLAAGGKKRRGRPPKWMQAIRSAEPAPRKRKPFSAETRKKMAQSQKARWAAAKTA